MMLQSAITLARTAGQLALVAGAVLTLSHARNGSLKLPKISGKWLARRAPLHSAEQGRFQPDELSYSHWMS